MRIRNEQDFSVKSANGKRGEIPGAGMGFQQERALPLGGKSRPATEEQTILVTPEGSCEACSLPASALTRLHVPFRSVQKTEHCELGPLSDRMEQSLAAVNDC